MVRSAGMGLGAAALAITLCASPAHSEVFGPLLPRGGVELGFQQRWVERTEVTTSQTLDWSQYDLSAVARWGATDFATFSFEGMTGVGPWLSDHDDTQLFYLLGVSAQATIWRAAKVTVTGAYHYTLTFQRYDDSGSRTLETYSEAVEILAQTDARLWGQQVTFWGGPVGSAHSVNYPPGITYLGQDYVAETVWGGVVGLSVLAWRHVDLSGHLLWVENPQPRVTLLYRF